MSTNEEKLSKLKVAELKELLAANHLVQSGKKDELVKRLVDNNVSAEGGAADAPATQTQAQEEDLLDVADLDDAPASEPAPAAEPAAAASTTEATPSTAPELTPEQLAMKKRAERFGVPFNPNPTPTARPAPAPAASKASPAGPTTAAAPAATASGSSNGAATGKPSAIDKDKSSLGVSDEKLAARAAKFGLPDKKPSAPASTGAGPAPSAKALQTADAEISPEMAAKIAEEEEKRRKRAEKFGTGAGTGAGATTAGVKHSADGAATSDEPDAKKAKA